MNDEQAKALGLRAVATGLWLDRQGLWPEGALAGDGRRCLASTWYDGPWHTWWGGGIKVQGERDAPDDAWPDFRDDATRGCLLGRVRTLHDDDSIWPQRIMVDRWQMNCSQSVYVTGTTEVEALVAALEAAPTRAKRESENA